MARCLFGLKRLLKLCAWEKTPACRDCGRMCDPYGRNR